MIILKKKASQFLDEMWKFRSQCGRPTTTFWRSVAALKAENGFSLRNSYAPRAYYYLYYYTHYVLWQYHKGVIYLLKKDYNIFCNCGLLIIEQQETHRKTRRKAAAVGFGRKDQISGVSIPELLSLSLNRLEILLIWHF